MRTSILIGAMIIGDSINPEMIIPDNVATFVGVMFIIFAVMDLTEFIKKQI